MMVFSLSLSFIYLQFFVFSHSLKIFPMGFLDRERERKRERERDRVRKREREREIE